jgi:hypothetical protein
MAKTTVAKRRGPKVGQQGKSRPTAKDEASGNNRHRPAISFSERKSIEELAAE